MRIEFNGRKIVNGDHFINCIDCPLDTDGFQCLAYFFGIREDCTTGFEYEDNI